MKLKATITAVMVVMVALSAFAMPASAATITVNPDGTGDYTTIQEAVDNAASGDVIQVEGGTYYETVYVSTSDVTIESANGETVNIVANKANGTDAFSYDSSITTAPTVGANITEHDQNTTEVNTGATGAYATIQEAVNNTDSGDKVVIAPGTYNESVNVTSDYLMFVSSDTTQNVTIDASNTTSGEALVLNDNTALVHDSVKTVSGVLGGGGTSDTLNGETGGIPNIVWAIVVVVGGYYLYSRQEE